MSIVFLLVDKNKRFEREKEKERERDMAMLQVSYGLCPPIAIDAG